MYPRTSDFIAAAGSGRAEPEAILSLVTSAGRRLYAKFKPDLTRTGLDPGVPLLSQRDLAVNLGSVSESLSSNPSESLGALSQGRFSDLIVTLANRPDDADRRHFSRLLGLDGEGLVGAESEVVITYPGLTADDAVNRFSGRIRRAELTEDAITIRLRAV